MNAPLKIIMIDNFDSFTYNLVNQFRMLEAEVIVFRNDTPLDSVFTQDRLDNENLVIVISPGPGNPDSAGNTLEIIEKYSGEIPILGICLGHQSIIQQQGGEIDAAQEIVHGKAHPIYVNNTPTAKAIFTETDSTIQAARYHSLAAKSIPKNLEVIATTSGSSQEIMAVAEPEKKLLGFQFHPESILTTQGSNLLRNALQWLTSKNSFQNL